MSGVTVVAGAQYGSEGKGVIVAHLANKFGVHIRVGGPNAGHTFIHKGVKWKMQIVPCGWKNPNATLIIGRGGLIEVGQLIKEVNAIAKVDRSIIDRLKVDAKAGVLSSDHRNEEGGTSGEFHFRIGSTGEGVGAARTARISRNPKRFKQVGDIADEVVGSGWRLSNMVVDDTPAWISTAIENGANVLIEGTQGSGLSLIHGPWPYCTSHCTDAAQMLADVGISPFWLIDLILVCRTYPIRVWGNSGPMHAELTWEELSQRIGKTVREYTTVTKKLRRIGEWDEKLFMESVIMNKPTSLAVTFLDYLNPADEGKRSYEELSDKSKEFIAYVERISNTKVNWLCTGWSQELNDWVIIPG